MKSVKGRTLFLIGFVLVALDQITKILVKTNMSLGESIPLISFDGSSLPWLQNFLSITFVENEGMAFGMKWGGAAGKIVLTLFRVGLFSALWWWISKMLKRNRDFLSGQPDATSLPVPSGVLAGLAVIAAGAFGNIVDCMLYGQIFSASSWGDVAVFGGSYAPVLLGKVVDMIHFGFFPPVFNVADSCVTCGAVYLVLFQWKFFSSDKKR